MLVHRQTLRVFCTLLVLTNSFGSELRRQNEQSSAINEVPQTIVGVYHWSGQATRSISQGVKAAADLGSSAVRIAFSARSNRDYNVNPQCIGDFNLAEYLTDPDVQLALSHPAIRTIMITAYDGVSYGDCEKQSFLTPTFYTAENRARMVQEYADFTFELYKRYAATGKTFLIANWESDNAVYCGSSHLYSHDVEFRRSCTEVYPTKFGGNVSPDDSLLALRHWFEVRWEGMQQGRTRAADVGLDGVTVYMVPEVNSIRDLQQAGYLSVLAAVIPKVKFDFISYSSWETLNGPNPAEQLKADLEEIRSRAATPNVIIGELGYATAYWGANTVRHIEDAIKAASEARVSYVFQWVLYEDATATGYGLLDERGERTILGSNYRPRYAHPPDTR